MIKIFSKYTQCDKCQKEVEKKRTYNFDSTYRGERNTGEKLTLCRNCFFQKLGEYINMFPAKVLAFHPIEKFNAYHYYNKNHLKKYNFPDEYIETMENALSKSPETCTICASSNPQFFWVESKHAFGNSFILENALENQNTWLCKSCFLKEYKNKITTKDLYFREFMPPIDENGMMSSWEC